MSLITFTKRRGVQVTHKQVLMLRALIKRNKDGSYLDVYQLIDRCAPGTTRGAMICSLRHLASHGLVCEGEKEKRRSRVMRTYAATQAGVDLMRPSKLPLAP